MTLDARYLTRTPKARKTVRYYAATFNGKTYDEVLVTNQDTHFVSEEPTGITYRSFRSMEDGVAAKNRVR